MSLDLSLECFRDISHLFPELDLLFTGDEGPSGQQSWSERQAAESENWDRIRNAVFEDVVTARAAPTPGELCSVGWMEKVIVKIQFPKTHQIWMAYESLMHLKLTFKSRSKVKKKSSRKFKIKSFIILFYNSKHINLT